MKKKLVLTSILLMISLVFTGLPVLRAADTVTLTVAVVNNPDQRKLLALSDSFHAAHPNINLSFVMLPENELRDRVTTDITTKTGSFDIVQVGTYDTPVFAKNNWLASVDDLMTTYPNSVQPNYDVNDLLKPIRLGLSYNSKLYALPFYGESSMTFYNKKMFADAGLTMPDEPTWDQIKDLACKLNKPAQKQYGIAMR